MTRVWGLMVPEMILGLNLAKVTKERGELPFQGKSASGRTYRVAFRMLIVIVSFWLERGKLVFH